MSTTPIRRSRGLRSAVAALFAATLFFTANEAEAIPEVLRENTHPWFFTGGIGPSFGITGCGSGGCGSGFNFSQFKISPEFGYHFSGDFEGPAIGGNFDLAFGAFGGFGSVGSGIVRFEPGFKFWWDIKVKDGLGVYITPFAKAGYGLLHFSFGNFSQTTHFFNTNIGAEGRLSLGDRGIVFFRPLSFDMLANDGGIALFYEVIAGGGVTWGG